MTPTLQDGNVLPFTCPHCGDPFGFGADAVLLTVVSSVPFYEAAPCCGERITGTLNRHGQALLGTYHCCGGYGEHFAWCADQMACERRRLHERLVTRGVVRPIVGDTRGACRHGGPGYVHRGIVVCGVCRSDDWRQLRGAMT